MQLLRTLNMSRWKPLGCNWIYNWTIINYTWESLNQYVVINFVGILAQAVWNICDLMQSYICVVTAPQFYFIYFNLCISYCGSTDYVACHTWGYSCVHANAITISNYNFINLLIWRRSGLPLIFIFLCFLYWK